MDSIIKLDHTLFTLVNSTLKTGILDSIMPVISNETNIFILVLFILATLFIIYRKFDVRSLVTLLLLVFISDFCNEKVKAIFARPRPCISIEGVNLLAGCSDSYSFPSGHATNIFAAMLFISLKYPRFAPPLMAIAFVVAYSRVYVGVHFPLDVTAGALSGSLIAASVFMIDRYLHNVSKSANLFSRQ